MTYCERANRVLAAHSDVLTFSLESPKVKNLASALAADFAEVAALSAEASAKACDRVAQEHRERMEYMNTPEKEACEGAAMVSARQCAEAVRVIAPVAP